MFTIIMRLPILRQLLPLYRPTTCHLLHTTLHYTRVGNLRILVKLVHLSQHGALVRQLSLVLVTQDRQRVAPATAVDAHCVTWDAQGHRCLSEDSESRV